MKQEQLNTRTKTAQSGTIAARNTAHGNGGQTKRRLRNKMTTQDKVTVDRKQLLELLITIESALEELRALKKEIQR